MPGKKGHQLNMHLTEEEYGWLVRYAEKTDQSMASIARKALRMYISVIAKSKQKQEQANEAKSNIFVEDSETATGNGVQTSRDAG